MAIKYFSLLATLPLALINAQAASSSSDSPFELATATTQTRNTYFTSRSTPATTGAYYAPYDADTLSALSKIQSYVLTKTRDKTFLSVASVLATADPELAFGIAPTGTFTTDAWYTSLPGNVKSYISSMATELSGLLDPTAAVTTAKAKAKAEKSAAAGGMSGLGVVQVTAVVLSGVAGAAMIWL